MKSKVDHVCIFCVIDQKSEITHYYIPRYMKSMYFMPTCEEHKYSETSYNMLEVTLEEAMCRGIRFINV